jgi:hypothetical protein
MNAINLTVFTNVFLQNLVEKGHMTEEASSLVRPDIQTIIDTFIPELKTHVKNYKETLKPAKKKPTSITCDKNDAIVADIVKAANTPIVENAKVKRVYRKKPEEPTTTVIVLKDELAEELYVE